MAALPLLAAVLHDFWRDKNRSILTTRHRLEEEKTQNGGMIWFGLADKTHLKIMPQNADGAAARPTRQPPNI